MKLIMKMNTYAIKLNNNNKKIGVEVIFYNVNNHIRKQCNFLRDDIC